MKRLRAMSIAVTFILALGAACTGRAAAPAIEYQTSIPGYYLGNGDDIVADSEGNAYVIASWYEDHQHLDILVVKLDPEGSPVWTLPITGDPLQHDYASDITLDSSENVWITGYTASESFPLVNALDDSLTGFTEAFIMKLDPDNGTILYSTYLGGDYSERGYGITIDDAGEIYVVGSTGSTDFPTTPDAYQDHPSAPLYIYTDAFITKLSPQGDEILYSTYFGGFKDDYARNVRLDGAGNIIISGQTGADDFPLVNPIQTAPDGIFVSKLSADGSTLLFSTYLGGEDSETLRKMDVDAGGFVYITGQTRSIDYPATPGAFQDVFVGEILGCEEGFPAIDVNCFDGFLTKLATDGSEIVYSTFIRGSTNDRGSDVIVDNAGRAHVVGYTASADFLGTGNSTASIFVTELTADGGDINYALTRQSPGAGAGHGIALDGANDVFVTGVVGIPYKIYIAKLGGDETAGITREETDALGALHLGPAVPNPFNETTRVSYSLPSGGASPVSLRVHDARGRLVRTLFTGLKGPGTYSVAWDGTDNSGGPVASGVYFYRLEWNGRGDTRRVVVLK
jgi:hypothetical protein